VDVSIQELTEQYRKFSDEELLRYVQSGTLTPMATELATAELHSRGIEPQRAVQASDTTADASEDADVVTVAEFWDPTKGIVLQARLESEGLSAFVWPDVTGGITRVEVRSDQVERAKEVMSSIERGELAIPDSPDAKESDGYLPKFARGGGRAGGAMPFAITGLGLVFIALSSLHAPGSMGGPPNGAALGTAIALQLLMAGGFFYLAWRTYRKPTVLLCSLATLIAAWGFIGAARTHSLSALHATALVGALWALYFVLVWKSPKTGDPAAPSV